MKYIYSNIVFLILILNTQLLLASEWQTVFSYDGQEIDCPAKESPDIISPKKCFDQDGNEKMCVRNRDATWRSYVSPETICQELSGKELMSEDGDQILRFLSCGLKKEEGSYCLKVNLLLSPISAYYLCEFLATQFEADFKPPLNQKWELMIYSEKEKDYVMARCLLSFF